MPETGYSRSPRLVRGALVQLAEDIIGIIPNIIPFQYNPETLSRTLTPWNPFERSEFRQLDLTVRRTFRVGNIPQRNASK